MALVIDRIGEAEHQLGDLEASRASLIEAEKMALLARIADYIGESSVLTE